MPLVEGVELDERDLRRVAQFAVSVSGSLVYVRDSPPGGDLGTLIWVAREGEETVISDQPRAYGRPRISPDGTRVAVDTIDADGQHIWIWDLVRGNGTKITFDEGSDNYPLWTPDGERVVFTSTRDGGGLFWKPADGTGQVERLKDGLARPYAWTSDGRLIFEEDGDIGVLTTGDDRGVEMLLDETFFEGEPSLSPDGRWLVYYSAEGSEPRVYVRPFPNVNDGKWGVSLGFGVQPVWSPDGRELFYRSRTDLMVAQVETDSTFAPGAPEPLFNTSRYGFAGVNPADARMWDLSPDGSRFIFRTAARVDAQLIFIENWFEELKRLVPVD